MKIVAILHNIRSLHNVGSIFRTANAAGAEKIYLCGITPAPFDRFGHLRPQFAKVALGAEKFVSWDGSARSPQAVLKLMEKLREEDYKILAVEQSPKSIPYYRSIIKGQMSKVALVFGNEVRGLPPSILKLADKILEIPMRGAMVRHAGHPRNRIGASSGKESLNVAVAFGIVAFHIADPRRFK